jgi:hypothetical protein
VIWPRAILCPHMKRRFGSFIGHTARITTEPTCRLTWPSGNAPDLHLIPEAPKSNVRRIANYTDCAVTAQTSSTSPPDDDDDSYSQGYRLLRWPSHEESSGAGFSKTSTKALLGYALLKEMKPLLISRTLYIRRHLRSAHTTTSFSLHLSTAPARTAGVCRLARRCIQEVACQHLERVVRLQWNVI